MDDSYNTSHTTISMKPTSTLLPPGLFRAEVRRARPLLFTMPNGHGTVHFGVGARTPCPNHSPFLRNNS